MASSNAVSMDESALDGLPEEELLRLDDGTPLPVELAELRTLLTLQASVAGEADLPSDCASSEPLAALRREKAAGLRDVLMGFDDSILFLHDLLLDHERLCRRLQAVRRKNAVQPAGSSRFDEAFEVGDEEGEDWKDWLGDEPWIGTRGSANDGAAPAAADDDDEEALDQQVCASRSQIKKLLSRRAADS